MRAVIMAGGEGRRLRPLTFTTPKPMLKLCGKPMLEYVVELLGKNGVEEAWVTLQYKPEAVMKHFKTGSHRGVKLNFVIEKTPLGTAGGVKNAVGDSDEDFIVISGDALCDVDLMSALLFHRDRGADVTAVTRRVDDPRKFGLADIGEDGGVRGFVEKPGWSEAFTDMANTGIYIVSGLCLRDIPADTPADFAKDVFPKLVQKGSLFACPTDGYWRDIGSPSDFMAAQQDIINKKTSFRPDAELIGGCYYAGSRPEGNYVVEAPCYIGRDVRVGDGVVIGENSIIGDGAVLGARSRTAGCCVGEGCVLGDNSFSRGCIICDGGSTGRNSTAAAGSIIGPCSVLGDDAVLGEGVTLSEFEVVPDESIMTKTPSEAPRNTAVLTSEAIAGRLGSAVTPQLCLRVGRCLAQFCKDRPVCVADDGLNASYVHKQILIGGILADGGQVYDTGVMFAGQLRYAVDRGGSAIGVLVSGYGQGIQIVGLREGIPGELEKLLEKALEEPTEPAVSDVMRLPEMLSGITALWENSLLSALPDNKPDFEGTVFCRNAAVADVAAKLFMQLGGRSGAELSFNISGDASSVNISSGGEIAVTHSQLLALCARYDFERGCDIVVPAEAPRVLEKIAQEAGRRVFRRPYGQEQSVWSCDGVSTLLYALTATGNRERLFEAASELPATATVTRRIECGSSTARIMGRVMSRNATRLDRGAVMAASGGWITVKPSPDGKTLSIISEAVSRETASELCAYFEKWIDD